MNKKRSSDPITVSLLSRIQHKRIDTGTRFPACVHSTDARTPGRSESSLGSAEASLFADGPNFSEFGSRLTNDIGNRAILGQIAFNIIEARSIGIRFDINK